ncbi:MAG: DMT family transporter [Nitrospinae bacterium]|nr:DMT family transporter [Nitrospinota bacterium]
MIYMIAATLLFSFGPVLIRMGINHGVSPDQLMVLRLAVASPLFFIAVVARKTVDEALPAKKDILFILLLSLAGMGGAMFCFFRAISYLGASVTTLLGAVTPVFTVILAYLIHRKPVKRHQVASMAFSFIGVALLIVPMVGVGGVRDILSSSMTGVLYVMAANLFASATSLGFENYVKKKSPLVASFHVTVLMLLFFGALNGVPRTGFDADTWWIVILLGSVTWFVPFVLFFHGIREMGASNAVIVQNSGPMVTVFAAGLLLGEKLTYPQFAGMAVILFSVFLLKGWRQEQALADKVKIDVSLPKG